MRFTVRWMLALVAILGLGMASTIMWRRSSDFRVQATFCHLMANVHYVNSQEINDPKEVSHHKSMTEYYKKLRLKYERAARCPWLNVDPDPPEPE